MSSDWALLRLSSLHHHAVFLAGLGLELVGWCVPNMCSPMLLAQSESMNVLLVEVPLVKMFQRSCQYVKSISCSDSFVRYFPPVLLVCRSLLVAFAACLFLLDTTKVTPTMVALTMVALTKAVQTRPCEQGHTHYVATMVLHLVACLLLKH